MAKSVLVVGAGGFTGGFICSECSGRGYDTWPAVRATTSRQYLDNPAYRFAVLDFTDSSSLRESLRTALEEKGSPWDYIIYNLGATKCLRFADFNRVNYQYLQWFTEALKALDAVPEKMLYISSLSAMGKHDEKTCAPYTEKLVPIPDTRYGASKLKAEMWLATCGIPTVILRPTGIYGPRDKDYFLMFKSIRQGIDVTAGFRKQVLTFLYVEDLARACCDALERARAGQTYIVGHPAAHTQKEFRALVKKALGKKAVLPLKLPLWGVKLASTIAEKIGAARGVPSTLNRDKYRIIAQRNWNIDISKAREDFGFSPRIDLEEGVRRCAEWYIAEKWLKPASTR